MFAPRYTVPVGDLMIEMGPPKNKSEVEEFAEQISSAKVTQYLGHSGGVTPEDETEWYEKVRKDAGSQTWMLFDVTNSERVLVGSSSYKVDPSCPLKTAVSGFLVARPEYWGKGIAKMTHRVRTWHAFARDGIVCLRSAVYQPNIGSLKALQSIGYQVVATERNQLLDSGQLVDKFNLECVNPSEHTWNQWWHGDPIPEEFEIARRRSVEALDWVREEVKPFEA